MIPLKPFDTYKWRWLHVQPSEGLLKAPVYLGVLRALAEHEGEPYSSKSLQSSLGRVDAETDSSVTLARDPQRNLFRNSGQYWRGTGLLAPERGIIHLTALGRRVAGGQITQGEFAALMVQQTLLPNHSTYSIEEISKWDAAGLKIRPLKLILEIIEELGTRHGAEEAYMTAHELIRLVIPLAGNKLLANEIASYIERYRRRSLDITGWPDCASEANDLRLAREFLLFLANFGLLRQATGTANSKKYFMEEVFNVDAATTGSMHSIFEGDESASKAVAEVRHSLMPSIIERQKVMVKTAARTGQSRFRSRILSAYQGKCFLTGEAIPEVLEAAHVIPVSQGGSDDTDNGFCLRVDIHRLFDAHYLRFRPDGTLFFSEAMLASQNYLTLPKFVQFPTFVKPANIAWRDNYQ